MFGFERLEVWKKSVDLCKKEHKSFYQKAEETSRMISGLIRSS